MLKLINIYIQPRTHTKQGETRRELAKSQHSIKRETGRIGWSKPKKVKTQLEIARNHEETSEVMRCSQQEDFQIGPSRPPW